MLECYKVNSFKNCNKRKYEFMLKDRNMVNFHTLEQEIWLQKENLV
jgi:hypothetical protein